MEKLKLFVWSGFSPDYSSGLAFAVAKSETEARELIELNRGYEVYTWGKLEILPINAKVARSVCGGG